MKLETRSRLFCFFTLVSSSFIPQSAQASSKAHGGDLSVDGENVFFFGDDPVEYCISVGSDFSLENAKPGSSKLETELATLVREVVDDWLAFFEKYRIGSQEISRKDGKNVRVATKFKKVAACTTPGKQLHFFFGHNEEIAKKYPYAVETTLGAAIRGDYDHESLRTGGIIWIKAFSKERIRIKHMLLHEMGHVLGMRHNSVFVMDQNAAFSAQPSRPVASLGVIESPDWRFTLKDGDVFGWYLDPHCDPFFGPRLSDVGQLGKSLLPNSERERLKLPDRACIGYQFRYVKETAILEDRYEMIVAGLFESEGFVELTRYQGQFLRGLKDPGGPVYSTPRRGDLAQKFDDPEQRRLPAKGFFELGRLVYPTLIEKNNSGIEIKMFDPENKKWWKNFGREFRFWSPNN